MRLIFTAYQLGCAITLQTHVKADNAPQVCGNMLNELFSWVTLQRSVGAEGLRLSDPIKLKFTYKGKVYDTGKWRVELVNKLKVQNTGRGKKLFAQRFHAIFMWVIRERQNVPFEQLLTECEQMAMAEAN